MGVYGANIIILLVGVNDQIRSLSDNICLVKRKVGKFSYKEALHVCT